MYELCDAWAEDESCVRHRVGNRGGGGGGGGEQGADPPTHRKPFLRNTDDGWPGVPATEEALSSHQLRLTSQNLFHDRGRAPTSENRNIMRLHTGKKGLSGSPCFALTSNMKRN